MNILIRKTGKFTLGIWLAIGALLLSMLAWFMQAFSLHDWEKAVELGLQNHSFGGSETEIAWATKERGEAIADLLWPFPIAIVAFVGLLKEHLIGFLASMMEFAICIYFPLFYVFQVAGTHPETVLVAVLLWGLPSILGIMGLWANRRRYMKPETH